MPKPISSYIVVQQQQVSFFASLKCNFQSFEFYGSGSTENYNSFQFLRQLKFLETFNHWQKGRQDTGPDVCKFDAIFPISRRLDTGWWWTPPCFSLFPDFKIWKKVKTFGNSKKRYLISRGLHCLQEARSRDPKLFIFLKFVADTRAELSMNTEIYVKPGSALSLECRWQFNTLLRISIQL